MIKVVLLDADGVLINGVMFSTQLEKDYGISSEMTTPFFKGKFKECLSGKLDLKETILPYLKEWGWEKSVDEFFEYWFRSEHHIDEKLVKYAQTLRKKGIKCCVATNQEKYRLQYILDKMGFSKSFDKVYASSALGAQKPSLEFYKRLMDDLKGIQKNEVLFWDNSIKHVEGAKEFGINAEIYTTYKDFETKMRSYINL